MSDSHKKSPHEIIRRIRFDRVAVVAIPLLLIIIFIIVLSLHSCGNDGEENENSVDIATPVAVLESDDAEDTQTSEESTATTKATTATTQTDESSATEMNESSDNNSSDSDSRTGDNSAAGEKTDSDSSNDASVDSSTSDANGSDSSVSSDSTVTNGSDDSDSSTILTQQISFVGYDVDVSIGDLIVINNNTVYDFTEDEEDLLYVYQNRSTSYQVSDWEVRLTADTIDALNTMMDAYQNDTGNRNFTIFNGYRTYDQQDDYYHYGGSNTPAGYSDYHSARSFNVKIEFGDGTSDYYNSTKYPDYSWLSDNAADYGFIVRYPEDKTDYTGESARTYTFRYVGIPHAVYITDNDLCLEEYVTLVQDYTSENPLEITAGGINYQVFYVSEASASGSIAAPGTNYTISGDNMGGYIVTCW